VSKGIRHSPLGLAQLHCAGWRNDVLVDSSEIFTERTLRGIFWTTGGLCSCFNANDYDKGINFQCPLGVENFIDASNDLAHRVKPASPILLLVRILV
jgi:hypothetical protein